jgi:phosphoglycolate phosphatase
MADYQLLVFDWDGTLADSIGRIVISMRHGARACGLPWRDDMSIKGIIGLGLPEAIASLYPELSEVGRIEAFRQAYAEHYLSLESEPLSLFPGVREGLERFRQLGYRLAVATGKSRRGMDRVLGGLGWQTYFDITRCADETASKPDPLMLAEILAHCQVPPERALMVGDSSFDLLMAQRAGMDCVAVGYGAQPLENLLAFRPRFAIDAFSQLQDWLERGRASISSQIESEHYVG